VLFGIYLNFWFKVDLTLITLIKGKHHTHSHGNVYS